MRIAVWYNLPSGGAKRALYDHVVGLQRLGHDVELWRPLIQQSDYLDLSRLAPEHEVPFEVEGDQPKSKPAIIRASVTKSDRYALAMARHARTCAAQIDAGGFDVLFANTDFLFHAPHIGRYATTPKLLYLQEPNRPLFEALPRMPWVPDPLADGAPSTKGPSARFRHYVEMRNAQRMAAEEIENARHYDRILVNSLFSRESVLRAYGVDARVCYLGIEPRLFQNLHLPRERFVMSVGSFWLAKNPKLIIESIGRVSADIRPPLVWVYNMEDEAHRSEMERLARSLGVDLQLRKLVSDEELVSLLNRAAAFVYAPRLEPFGLAPLEANACGTPVIAVAEGGVRETVENGVNGLLTVNDPDLFAEAITTLLQDSELAQGLGAAGERLVREKWSTTAAAERLQRHLEAVAGKG